MVYKSKKQIYTPLKVRNEIIKCFYNAHKDLIESRADLPENQKKKLSKKAVIEIVKEQFNLVEGEYEKPTKVTLLLVLRGLAGIASQFREEKIINAHLRDMHAFIDKI